MKNGRIATREPTNTPAPTPAPMAGGLRGDTDTDDDGGDYGQDHEDDAEGEPAARGAQQIFSCHSETSRQVRAGDASTSGWGRLGPLPSVCRVGR
jgi:hypothetical protein